MQSLFLILLSLRVLVAADSLCPKRTSRDRGCRSRIFLFHAHIIYYIYSRMQSIFIILLSLGVLVAGKGGFGGHAGMGGGFGGENRFSFMLIRRFLTSSMVPFSSLPWKHEKIE